MRELAFQRGGIGKDIMAQSTPDGFGAELRIERAARIQQAHGVWLFKFL